MSAPGPASQAQLTSTQHLTISKEEDHEHPHWRTSNAGSSELDGEGKDRNELSGWYWGSFQGS